MSITPKNQIINLTDKAEKIEKEMGNNGKFWEIKARAPTVLKEGKINIDGVGSFGLSNVCYS